MTYSGMYPIRVGKSEIILPPLTGVLNQGLQ